MYLTHIKVSIAALLCLVFDAYKHEQAISEAQDTQANAAIAIAKCSTGALACTQQVEQTDYTIYKMKAGCYRIGDMVPYLDAATNKFIVYFFKDVWDDATKNRNPMYAFTITDFVNYMATWQVIG